MRGGKEEKGRKGKKRRNIEGEEGVEKGTL